MTDSPREFQPIANFDQELAQRVLQGAQALVLVLDDQQRILWANSEVEDITGIRLEHLSGLDWRETLIPVEQQSAAGDLFSAARNRSVRDVKFSIGARDRTQREIAWSGRTVKTQTAGTAVVCIVGHDITELNRSQARSLEVSRLAAIGHMAVGLAHEGRNALQQITSCAEMLAMELAGRPEALDLISGIQDAEARLHRLFEDVRAFGIPLQLNPRQIEVCESWRNAWATARRDNARQQSRLVERLTCSDLRVSASIAHLEQAFIKIFENAHDACALFDEIEVRCWDTQLAGRPALAIAVRDRGPGFTIESLPRAFEPYFSTKTQGTGLGLPIVKRIIEAHHGTVTAANAPAGGAVIEMILPREH